MLRTQRAGPRHGIAASQHNLKFAMHCLFSNCACPCRYHIVSQLAGQSLSLSPSSATRVVPFSGLMEQRRCSHLRHHTCRLKFLPSRTWLIQATCTVLVLGRKLILCVLSVEVPESLDVGSRITRPASDMAHRTFYMRLLGAYRCNLPIF